MVSCCACSRTRNEHSRSRNISFYKLPQRPEMRRKWISFLLVNHSVPESRINVNSILCSRHFLKSDLLATNNSRSMALKATAVPAIVIVRKINAKKNFHEIYLRPDKVNTDENENMDVEDYVYV